jgi:hypothetical protein
MRLSPDEVTTRTSQPDITSAPNSWAMSDLAYQLAASTMTRRTPLLSIRSSVAAKPGRVSTGSGAGHGSVVELTCDLDAARLGVTLDCQALPDFEIAVDVRGR